MKKETLKTFAQGAVTGAIVLVIGIFWSGLVVTSGTAKDMAQTQARVAVIDQLAPICVAQFSLAENHLQLRKDLEAKESWNQAAFVKTGGWATMPGSEAPRDDIARMCAEMILKLKSGT
jgi:hypothetical protein